MQLTDGRDESTGEDGNRRHKGGKRLAGDGRWDGTVRLGRVADWLWRLCTALGFSLRTVTDVEGPVRLSDYAPQYS
jgi:hypothetical protein